MFVSWIRTAKGLERIIVRQPLLTTDTDDKSQFFISTVNCKGRMSVTERGWNCFWSLLCY